MGAFLKGPGGRHAVLFTVALSVRLLHLALLHNVAPEIVEHPVLDPAYYHRFAQDILAGTGLAERVFFMNPAYPYFLATVYALAGPSPLVAAVVQSLFGAAGVVVFFWLCTRWFGSRTALVAACVLAVYQPFVINAALLETVEIGVFLFLLSLWLAQEACHSGHHTWLRGVLSGVAFVLAALCRGNVIFAAPALLLAPLVIGEGHGWTARLKRTLPLAVGMALVVFSVGIRNRLVGGEWVWLTAYPGQNLYLASHQGAVTGTPHEPPAFLRPDPAYEETDFRAEAERLSGRSLTTKQVSDFWSRRAVEELIADPGFTIIRFFRKMGLAIGAYEIADNYNLAYLSRLTPFHWIPLPNFAAIVGLSLVGVGLAWARRRALVLLYGPAALYALSFGVFFVSSKIRIFVVPFLIALAAHAIVWIVDRRRQWRTVSAALGGVALVTVASIQVGPPDIRRLDWGQAINSHASVLIKTGRKPEGRRLQQKALALDPDNYFLLVNNGLAAYEEGHFSQAVNHCRRAIDIRPHLASAYDCLGITLAMMGNLAQAETALRQAATLDRDGPESRFNLAVLLARTG